MACKSDVDRTVEWYQETRPTIRQRLPSPSECHQQQHEYWRTVNLMDRATDQFGQQVMMLHQTNAAESVQKAYSDAHKATIDSIYRGYLRDTGWTRHQAAYCGGRIESERDPRGMCESNAKLPPFMPTPAGSVFWHMYGVVEYCIEFGIPPFA